MATPSSILGKSTLDIERSTAPPFQGGSTLLFPWKLHEMLRACAKEEKKRIVSWLPGGKAFKVHNVPAFVSDILPLYFKQSKYKSFQRQLNLWGFERIQNGPEKGAYHHKQFLRDNSNLCRHLRRQRPKKSAIKNSINQKKLSKVQQVSPNPPRHNRLPRKVSEGSLGDFEELHGRLNASFNDTLDPVDFEGVTFHLLEHDRCEELNLEFDFSSDSQTKKSLLLKELEQGFFGMPKS